MPSRRAFIALGLSAASGRAMAAPADDAPLVVGTSTPGGGFARYGEVLESLLNAREGRPVMRARPTRGTSENIALLQQGGIDAALIQGTAASEIFALGAGTELRILFAMYPSPGLLAVASASSVRHLEDVRGQAVVFGVRASGLVTLGRQVYSGIGIDIDRDVRAIYVEQAAESPRLVLAGDAVGLWGAGEGWPGFLKLADAPGGARFIGPSTSQVAAIVARYPLLTAMTVSAGAYPGIVEPLATVGSVNWIMTRADLDDRRAARFVGTMQAIAGDLAAALPQASFSTLANTLASAPAPGNLHRVLRS